MKAKNLQPDFNNTEIAFRAASNQKLYESYLVFKSLALPPLVAAGTTLITTALKLRLPVTPLIRHTIFRQFCGGTSINDCQDSVARMMKFGVGSILDYSVEASDDEEEMEKACHEVQKTIEHASTEQAIPCAVFKVTGLMQYQVLQHLSDGNKEIAPPQKQAYEKGMERINRLAAAASAQQVSLLIDAEESWTQDAIDQIALELMRRYNRERAVVFNTLQMYRHDRLAYMEKMYSVAKQENFVFGAKLVRGAYLEKERERAEYMGYPSPLYPDKKQTDAAFDQALHFCIDHIDRVHLFIGSHNEISNLAAVRFMAEKNVKPQDSRILFSQLFGMSDHISFNLAAHGYRVAKYLPYGPVRSVMPYLFRRAQENSSIRGQSGRELQLIERELKRRHTKG